MSDFNPRFGNFYPLVRFENQEAKGERIELLEQKFNKGLLNPVFGKGVFVNHIVYDFFTPLSLCGRVLTEVSSSRIVTPLGAVCRVCKSRYFNTLANVLTVKFDEMVSRGDSVSEFEYAVAIASPKALADAYLN